MSDKRIYLSPPHLGDLERRFLDEALATNWVAPLGPQVDAFERELAAYLGVTGAVALSSGTAAIHLGLRLLGVGQGDTVLCPSLTFVATANPILYEGATPVFIDCDPNTWCISPTALQQALDASERRCQLPGAVIAVDLYGQSADLDTLKTICTGFGVPFLEDAAEALGATFKEARCGGTGTLAALSFNGNKIITTSGGGALVGDDTEGLNRARHWASQSRDPAPHYQHTERGYNYRMPSVCAAVGRGQLAVLEERVAARRRVFDHYQEALSDIEGVAFMPEAAYGRSSRWLTVVTLDAALILASPAEIVATLEEANIEARRVWKPLHRQPLFQGCPYYEHSAGQSISDDLFSTGLCLPSGSSLTGEEQDRVIAALRAALRV